MAVLQMKKICIATLRKERKKLLEKIQRREDIEISDTSSENPVFFQEDISNADEKFNTSIRLSANARDILVRYYPKSATKVSSFAGRKTLPVSEYDSFSKKYRSILKKAYELEDLHEEIVELNNQIVSTTVQIDSLQGWLNFNLPLNYSGTDSTVCFKGTLPEQWKKEDIMSLLSYEDGHFIPAEVEIIHQADRYTGIAVYALKKDADLVESKLRFEEFVPPTVSSTKTAKELEQDLKANIAEMESNINENTQKIETYQEFMSDFEFLEDYDLMRQEKYHVLEKTLTSNNAFILNGYCTAKNANAIKEDLESSFSCVVDIQDIPEDEDAPVLLENNAFAAPLEDTVASYSLPGKGEIDPTFAISIFHYVLFGLMLSDAGYGLCMVLGCGFILWKYRKTMEVATKKNLQLFLYCGLATIFWGILFGSYFGDLPDVVAKTFFNYNLHTPALWFFPISEPMRLLAFSMIFGLVHLFTGLLMKGYLSWRSKDFSTLVFDVLFWLGLLLACVVILIDSEMVQSIFNYSLSLPLIVIKIGQIVAMICAIGIVLTNGRESKNPAIRVAKGAYALYGISGWLSDVLSYARLLALGLATGVIASVINLMASMVGASGNIIGIILFIIVCVIGHILNLGINALGAYVHAIRLEYVEFFGKFYEGGGSPFKPFGMNTKFYKFKESIKNE